MCWVEPVAVEVVVPTPDSLSQITHTTHTTTTQPGIVEWQLGSTKLYNPAEEREGEVKFCGSWYW